MKTRRILRDFLILVLFSGLFYACSIVVGQLENESPEKKDDFSAERLKGDELFRMKRWEPAVEEFRKLTMEDPFNGYAWFNLGSSYNEMRLDVYDEIEYEENKNASSQRLAELQDEVAALNKKAIEAYGKASEHLRYRRTSLFYLVVIHVDQGQYETALKYLEEFVNRKYVCYYQLDRYPYFGRTLNNGEKTELHQYGKFWDLVAQHAEEKLKRRPF